MYEAIRPRQCVLQHPREKRGLRHDVGLLGVLQQPSGKRGVRHDVGLLQQKQYCYKPHDTYSNGRCPLTTCCANSSSEALQMSHCVQISQCAAAQ